MRRVLTLILALLVSSLATVSYAGGVGDELKLAQLSRDELNGLIADIDSERELHHDTDSANEEEVLAATKEVVESYFSEQGIEISWAWVDYNYTRDWDFYTLSTHIDYRDSNDKKQKPDVYAELFCEDGHYNVYYLLIGTEVIINRREELPENLWSETPESVINAATGLDLSQMNVKELDELKSTAKNELSNNHSPNSTISSLVLSLTKLEVEQYFAQQGIDVSWPWFDYTYGCDWELYTLETSISYKDGNGDSRNDQVYAEAYPAEGQYTLCYLSVGDTVLIDKRNSLPENLYTEGVQAEATPEGEITLTPAPEPEETVESVESKEEIKPTPEARTAATPNATSTPEPIQIERGAKGEDVKKLQHRLIALGYLEGGADGDFGKKTEAAVKAFQKESGLEETGVFTNEDENALSEAIKEFSLRAILVAMTNAQSSDVFTADGSSYDKSKYHNYAYTDGLHAELYENGDWEKIDQDNWHVDNLCLKFEGVEDSYIKMTLDVCFDGECFVLSHVKRTMGRLAYLDSDDPSKLNYEEMEPSEFNSFLTVSAELVREDRITRGEKEAQETNTSTGSPHDSEREDWINSQFSIWNGAHKDLQELIKNNLNDEGSYEHIETSYIDIEDESVQNMVNEMLKQGGYAKRVEVGDLFIQTEFSAKNGFNARIKALAYGIASYKNNTVELIGIE